VAVPAEGTSREKVQAMTQTCADVLTQAVREHTQDWHMMQRVFTRDLVGNHVSQPALDSGSGDSA
jgi:lauroyl/myristoyl acyltransferase